MTARLTGLLALLAIVLAVAPAGASAAVPANVKRVIADYRNDGRIDPCRHSAKDLRDTLKAISADTEQYAPDFPSAVEAALEARARGDCDDKKKPKGGGDDGEGSGAAAGTPPTAPAPPAPQPVPSVAPVAPDSTPEAVAEPPAPPPGAGITPGTPPPADNKPNVVMTRPAVARASDDPPAALIVIGALLAACLLAGLALLAMRRLGWGEERLAGVRHAWAEAGYRTGGTWQDFTDWVRLGR